MSEFITEIKDTPAEELLRKIDTEKLPHHICIIMDGNRRWAKKRNLPSFEGHRAGTENFRKIMTASCELGIKILTVYAFSRENWKRSAEEVNFLMDLFVQYCHTEKQLMKDMGVQFNVLGKTDELPQRVVRSFKEVYDYTKDGDRMKLNVCINYSSRQEILDAVVKLAKDAKEGKVDLENVTEEIFSSYLYTSGQRDPDLMIRTSGELRISNFLLWQNAYSEFWFTNIFWPDFDEKALYQAILDYQKRDRRFGGGTPKIK